MGFALGGLNGSFSRCDPNRQISSIQFLPPEWNTITFSFNKKTFGALTVLQNCRIPNPSIPRVGPGKEGPGSGMADRGGTGAGRGDAPRA